MWGREGERGRREGEGGLRGESEGGRRKIVEEVIRHLLKR